MWEAPASLKRCIEVILCIELKQSYCEILESVPAVFAKLSWNFHPSLSNCSALAGNRQHMTGRDMTCDNIWPVEIWPGRDMTWSRYDLLWWFCTWKNCVLLEAFWDKISIFHLGQTEHCLTRCNGPLCAQDCALISFIWCRICWIDWTIEISPSTCRVFVSRFEKA